MGLASYLSQKTDENGQTVTVQLNNFADACYGLFERYLQSLNAREGVEDKYVYNSSQPHAMPY